MSDRDRGLITAGGATLPKHNHQGTVLVVDDNTANISILFESLRQANFKVLIAEDAATAMDRLNYTQPDIILLDIQMPHVDGFELYRQLKETYKIDDTPVIFLSIISDPKEKLRAFKLNAVDYITKPFNPHEVVARVEKHLALRNLQKSIELKNNQLEQEITERKRIEAQLNATLAEKEVLLKEVYHRVKNNLSSLISLISLQTAAIEDPDVVQMFLELQGRIKAMSLIHQKLYQSKDLAQIDFEDYLHELTADLIRVMWGTDRPLAVNIETENVLVNVNLAIPCSLIVNELVTNVLKHAFPLDRDTSVENQLNLKFQFDQNEYTLTVSDNGVGLPPGFDWQKTQSLGLKLANSLTTYQLGGTLEVKSHPDGTTFIAKFTP
jgi:two-component sensor histidine kinase/CheY-like chemotaxis protein